MKIHRSIANNSAGGRSSGLYTEETVFVGEGYFIKILSAFILTPDFRLLTTWFFRSGRCVPGSHHRFIIIVSAVIAFFCFICSGPAAAEPFLRISTENSESHVQTRAVNRFAAELQRRVGNRLRVEHYYNAELFRDRDVIDALIRGKVEMAVLGTWHLDKFEPSVGVFLLPAFYGRTREENHAVLEGPVGQTIVINLEKRIDVKVIGRWLDLGHAHLYGVKNPISRHEDLAGLKIRVPGGVANSMRIEALGAQPTLIAWPDLPVKLEQGVVDGMLTTHATLASSRLWEAGVRYAFEDRQYFPMYVPMIRQSFWRQLPQDLKTIILKTWDDLIDRGRLEAAQAQSEAAGLLTGHGVTIVRPDSNEVVIWREKIMSSQDRIVELMQIDPELVDQVMKTLDR